MNPFTPINKPLPKFKHTTPAFFLEEKSNKETSSEASKAKSPLFRQIALFSAILTWPLISFGAYVRLKGAGLACPDWPLCYGKIIPPAEFKIVLEVGHRFAASFLGLCIITLVILSWYKPQYKNYRSLSLGIFLLVCIQGVLGGLTVLMRLSPPTVVFHLIGGNTLFSLLIHLTYTAYYDARHPHAIPKKHQPLSQCSKSLVWMLLIIFFIIISGGANSSTYSGYVCSAFPGCHEGSLFSFHAGGTGGEGYFLPRFENEWIHMLHRLIAILGSVGLVILSWRILYRHSNRAYRVISIAIWSLLFIEIMVGIANTIYQIPVPISTVHTAIAATIVGLLSYSLAKSMHESH